MESSFKNILVVGLGLIGGSGLQATRDAERRYQDILENMKRKEEEREAEVYRMNPANIQGAPAMGGMNQQVMQQQMAMNNGSGYPIPPSGYDQFNNPYWIDPQTGQPTYTPPQSGLGIAQGIGKAVAWAKWLA